MNNVNEIHVTELLCTKELNIVSPLDSLNVVFSNPLRNLSGSSYYVVDERDILRAVLSEADLLSFIGEHLPGISRFSLSSYMDNISTVRIADIARREFPSIQADSTLTDAVALIDQGYREIPVVDSKGRLLGEINTQSVLEELVRYQNQGMILECV